MPQPTHIEFPSAETIQKVDFLSQTRVTTDISSFANLSPQQIADRVRGTRAIVNMSQATREEFRRLQDANTILRAEGYSEIEFYYEKDKINEITREITEQMLTIEKVRAAVSRFIREALHLPDAAAHEWNTFSAPRKNDFGGQHYWENIGLRKGEDPLREDVTALLDDATRPLVEHIRASILPALAQNPQLQDEDSIRRTLALAMVSNFVRATFYRLMRTTNMTELRAMALRILDEEMLTE